MNLVMRQISGLGNQLFQYAAGLYYAQQLSADLRLAIDMPQNQVSYGYPRPFLLGNFSIPVPMLPITVAERALFSARPSALVLAALLRATGTQVITESHAQRHHFLPALPVGRFTRSLYLFGYWQAWQIPDSVAPRLRQDLAFRHPAQGATLAVLERIAQTSLAVSLHVRRGDYTTDAEGNRTLPLAYYQAAVRHFLQLGSPTFFVFSDDIAWCRTALAPTLPGASLVFVDHNDDFSSHEDLRLMSACHHHILANSSFSWWGAWLNPRPEKQIFAPRFWLLTPDSYYPDTTPSHWHLWPAESSHTQLP